MAAPRKAAKGKPPPKPRRRATPKKGTAANPVPPGPPPEPPADAPPPPEVDGIITVLVKREGADTKVQIVPQGDVRTAELPTLLEHARQQGCALAGVKP